MSNNVPVELTEVSQLPEGTEINTQLDQSLLDHTQVSLNVSIGDTNISLAELKSLKENSILKLNQHLDSEFEIKWQDMLVATGKLVAVDEHLAIEITQVSGSGH